MIEKFTWQEVWLELNKQVPLLVNFFKKLLPKSSFHF